MIFFFSVLHSNEDEFKQTLWAGGEILFKNLKPEIFIPIHLRGNYEMIKRFKKENKIKIQIFDYKNSWVKISFK